MKITADANVLVRAIVADDPAQARAAQAALARAVLVAITPAALCELVWVLMRGYGASASEVATTIRALLASATVATHRPTAEAGLGAIDPQQR